MLFINKLSNFRKGVEHSTVFLIIKKHREIRSKGVFAGVFTDLSKAFDCISHQLLIAKVKCIRI